jgi:DNA replication protein DnaC
MKQTTHDSLGLRLRKLKLPSFVAHVDAVADRAEKEGLSFTQGLRELVDIEIAERDGRKIDRLRKQSRLPGDKTLASLDRSKLPSKIARQLPSLCSGGFVERAENILAFGLPGRGKSHVLSAIGHELVHRGISVLWTPTYRLVQQLLVAKRDLALEAELRRLDRFAVVILDDIGYVQQNREEMEVLFTFLAERYERKSVMVTSNLVFSQWDRIFKDAMTTAAAIDRLVHHSIILEMTGTSFRSAGAATLAEPADEASDATAADDAEVEPC